MSQASEQIAKQFANGNINYRNWGLILFNVVVYGAKGDGTDDTLSIQKAIDAAVSANAKSVFFPPGTYSATSLTDTDEVLFIGDNATLTVGGTATSIQQIGESDNPDQPALGKIMQDIANGTATTVAFYGDSTYYGYNPADGSQVAVPAPVMVQNIVRAFYGNTAFTALNQGVSGYGTTDVIGSWAATMAASTAKVVFINYGINDMQGAVSPAISAEKYRENLTFMVKTARKSDKIVVLETPNPVVSGGSLGSQAKAEGVKQFADVMRQVARELSVPLVDSYRVVEDYLSNGYNVSTVLPDGIHPSVGTYKLKGQNAAAVLLSPQSAVVGRSSIVPSTNPSVRMSGGLNSTIDTQGSRTGYGKIANSIRAAIVVKEPGTDIYVATPVWASGTTVCTIKVNTDTVATISMNDTNLTTNYGVDQEIMVVENAAPGMYLIELTAQGAENCGLYYVRTYPTRAAAIKAGMDSGITAPTYRVNRLALADIDITVSGAEGQHHVLTDIPVSRVIKMVDVEFKAQLGSDDGFVLFGRPMNDGIASPRGGIAAFLNASGFLTLSEGTLASYTNIVAVGSVDLRSAPHTYRFTANAAGLVNVYVDGSNIGSYTMTKSASVGGFIGFYKRASGTLRVDKVLVN